MPAPEEVEAKLRERAASEGRPIDAADAFLINMSRIIGVDATDRFLGKSHDH